MEKNMLFYAKKTHNKTRANRVLHKEEFSSLASNFFCVKINFQRIVLQLKWKYILI